MSLTEDADRCDAMRLQWLIDNMVRTSPFVNYVEEFTFPKNMSLRQYIDLRRGVSCPNQ